MKILRRYADEHGDDRKHIGAIAWAIMHDQVKRYAIKSGFFVIEQSGDTVKIDASDGFKPKEWWRASRNFTAREHRKARSALQ
jgi:hypothetical protein